MYLSIADVAREGNPVGVYPEYIPARKYLIAENTGIITPEAFYAPYHIVRASGWSHRLG